MTLPTVRASLLALLAAAAFQGNVASGAEPIAPKVLVITMFGGEAKPWLEGRALDTRVPSPASLAPSPKSPATPPACA